MQSEKMSGPSSYPEQPPPYSGPAPSHQPMQPYGMQATVVQPTVVPTVIPMVVGQQMSPGAARVTCRSCGMEIITRVESRPTMRTHLFAALLCLIGCWPCVCVPYCVDSCNNADHYCPNCNAYVGSYIN
ncbi:hypothetical protein O3G_MSEX005320 [Manduca sexta]|nr:hypothetical protein O3G_MSEX005320 [Manduca sexta]KAG6448062.1 hypothetical protein O3G_MSEX005320 [Manduca sexta]